MKNREDWGVFSMWEGSIGNLCTFHQYIVMLPSTGDSTLYSPHTFHPVAKIWFCSVEPQPNFGPQPLKEKKNKKNLWEQKYYLEISDDKLFKMQLLTELLTCEVRERSEAEVSNRNQWFIKDFESFKRLETIHVFNALYFPCFIFSPSEQYAAEHH